MTIQEAIEKSYQNGYGAKHAITFARVPNEIMGIDVALDSIFLDPLFWQCLFKDKTSISVVLDDAKTVLMNKECHYENGKYWMDIPQWRYYWHRLIDHLSEGKSIEDYFKQL